MTSTKSHSSTKPVIESVRWRTGDAAHDVSSFYGRARKPTRVAPLSYIDLRASPLPTQACVSQAGITRYVESRAMKNDIQIQQEVLAELDHSDKVPTGSVGVEVHHGVVKLAGPASDSTVKQNAELAARRVDGVTKVVLDMDGSPR
jgi:hypothetical protein